MSWLNFNDSLNNIKGQITNFASNVLAEEPEPKSKEEVEELKKLCFTQQEEIENLKKLNIELNGKFNDQKHDDLQPDTSWDWSTEESKTDQIKAVESITNLKKKITELENEKKDLLQGIEQLDLECQQNTEKLVALKEELQTENKLLKEKNTELLNENEELKSKKCETKNEKILADYQTLKIQLENLVKENSALKSTNKNLEKALLDTKSYDDNTIADLTSKLQLVENENKTLKMALHATNEKLKEFEIRSQMDGETCQKLAALLEGYEERVTALKKELEKSKVESGNTDDCLLEEALQSLKLEKTQIDEVNQRIDKLINDALFKCDHEIKTSSDLSEKVQFVINAMLNSEDKIRTLEKQIFDLTDEKTRILQDKNHEITKLLENSEILSQEVISKTQLLKEYEEECAELARNNELLINLASTYKSKGLQTISETNEDNLVQLESELENANRTIDVLQKTISNLDSSREDSDVEAGKTTESDSLKSMETENETLKNYVRELQVNLNSLLQENADLKTSVEKLKSELETAEYQFAEVNIQKESFQEEAALCKKVRVENEKLVLERDDLVLQNKKLNEEITNLNQSLKSKEVEEVKFQLSDTAKKLFKSQDTVTRLENLVAELTEKVQISKMAETSLKLQYDSVQKELANVTEAKLAREREVADMQVLLEEQQKRGNSLEEKLNSLQVDLISANEAKRITEIKLSEAAANAEALQKQIIEVQQQKISLEESYQMLQLSKDSDKNASEDQISKLLKTIENLTAEKASIEKMVSHQDGQISHEELQRENQELKIAAKKMEQIQAQLKEEQEEKIKHLSSEVPKLQDKISELDSYSKSLAQQNINLKKTIEELTNKNQFNASLLEENANLKLEMAKFAEAKSSTEHQQEEIHQKTLDELTSLKQKFDAQLTLFEEEKSSLTAEHQNLSERCQKAMEDNARLVEENSILRTNLTSSAQEMEVLKREIAQCHLENQERNNSENGVESLELSQLSQRHQEALNKISDLETQLQELVASRNELITVVQTKHQESITYHNEIQKLSQYLHSESEKNTLLTKQVEELKQSDHKSELTEQVEKLTDQNNFLKEKCDILTSNLLEEQSKLLQARSERSEREENLEKKLERLQNHLIEIEEHYTQELLQMEQKNAALQATMTEIEQREKNSSTMYTSVSIRANQQVEALQQQVQQLTSQREELRQKLSDAEDENNKKAAALTNLQFVLEQFQKEKENGVLKETERIRRQVKQEQHVQEQLRNEISKLQAQLEESKQGLKAALRLSDQLEASKRQTSGLKEEVAQLKDKIKKKEEELEAFNSQTDGKVDKSLIKNLVIGLVSTNNNLNRDQTQILKIIATVLDFNQQDHEKLKLNKPQHHSWLTSLLTPIPGQNISQESLSQAFVKFLENESKPRVVPSLLGSVGATAPVSSESSRSTTPSRRSPATLSEIVLPTFADFAQSRNSSSILKDVLKDNS